MSRAVSILIIDDDDIDVEVIGRGFDEAHIANPILRARDGQEGLDMLREPNRVPQPRVVLLDLNMPRLNGHDFLAELRADAQLRAEVIFVLTTSDNDEDIKDAYGHHVAGYIVKERAGEGFKRVVELLGHYWKIVELPEALGG